MLNYQASDDLPATLLACPKKGGANPGDLGARALPDEEMCRREVDLS